VGWNLTIRGGGEEVGLKHVCVRLTDSAGNSTTRCDSIVLVQSVGVRDAAFPGRPLDVWPNPAAHQLSYAIAPNSGVQFARLIDALGREVAASNVRSTLGTIDLRALPNGVYWLKAGDHLVQVSHLGR